MGTFDAWDLEGWLDASSQFVLDAVPVGIVVHGPDADVLTANRAAQELLGLTLAQMQDLAEKAPHWRAYRRDGSVIPFAEHAAVLALKSGDAQRGFEMGVDRPSGRTWLQVESVPFTDAGGSVAGSITSFVDVTDRVTSEERLHITLEATDTGTWDWNVGTHEVTWSPSAERLHGLGPGEFGGTFDDFVKLVHPDEREFVLDAIRRAVDDDEDYALDFRIVWPDGTVRWVAALGRVLRDGRGRAVRMVGTTHDVTDRKRSELEREASQRRLAFLAQATSVLAQSLDYETTLSRLARLAVPFLADWCGVDVLEDGVRVRRVAVTHADPDQADAARRLGTPPDASVAIGGPSVLRTGLAQVCPSLDLSGDDDASSAAAEEVASAGLLREIGVHSLIVMPLIARGRTLGAIWFGMAETPHSYEPVDVDLAQELARRAALAVDNARLYRERTRVARTLQETLLPPHLPSIPGLQVAARYRSAVGEEKDLGGDFYDMYESAPGTWNVVIGDVCGKGPEAAALTGLVRHTLRAAAMRERSPRAALLVLNEAILRADLDERFCTAAFARLELHGDGVAHLSLSCGGHPLPLVLRTDGSVEAVGEAGMLIGALPDPDLVDREVDLRPGDAVVFCTDGVTEAAGKRGFFGAERLQDFVATCVGLDAEAIADRLLDTVLTFQAGQPRDDLAVVVLRSVASP